ncbi:MAG: pilus assembly protein PilB, partial [Mariprofundus sp.]
MLVSHQKELIAAGLVSDEQMADALQSTEGSKETLLSALLSMPEIDADALLQTLARQYKVPYLDISAFSVNKKLLDKCPEQLCIKHGFV